MKPFRLEKVLDVRRYVRSERRNALAAALQEERNLLDQKAELEQQRAQQIVEISQLNQSGRFEIEATARRRYFTGQIDIQLLILGQHLQQIGQEIDALRQSLIEADQDVKALDRLKEKYIAEERSAEERRTEHQLSEQWQAANWNW